MEVLTYSQIEVLAKVAGHELLDGMLYHPDSRRSKSYRTVQVYSEHCGYVPVYTKKGVGSCAMRLLHLIGLFFLDDLVRIGRIDFLLFFYFSCSSLPFCDIIYMYR